MRHKYFFASLLILAFYIAGVIFAAVASAADVVTAYPIDIQEPLNYIVALIAAAVSAVGGFLLALFQRKTGIDLSDEHEEYLENAMASAILYAHDRAREQIARIDDPITKNKIIADTVNFVLTSIPSLLKRLGITPEKLAQMVEDRLTEKGVLTNGTSQPS